MRKLLLILIVLLSTICVKAATTYTWNVASGNFADPSSWSPARNSPASDDILLFDGSLTSTATVSGILVRTTVGQVIIMNNCAVTFASGSSGAGAGTISRSGSTVTGTGTGFASDFVAGDVVSLGAASNDITAIASATAMSTNSSGPITAGTAYIMYPRLTISGGANAFSIAAGSSLTISATTSVSIYLPTGSTGSISGNITFSGAAHRLNATDAASVTFNSGSIFTQTSTFGGNAFTVVSTSPNVINFASGSTFVAAGGSNPFGLSAPASKVVFNAGSLFKQTSGSPAFSGRTYADVEIASNASVSGGSSVVMNNLTVSGTTTMLTWGMTSTPGHSIKGNISVAAGCTFNINGAGTLNLNGTSVQTISNAGTFTIASGATVVDGNNAGIVLAAGSYISSIAGTLDLAGKPFTIKSNATGTGGIGPVTGTLNNATNVTVERYIPAHASRTYTLVGFGAFGSTIYNGWQEAGAATAGYGTQISGASAGNGFDFASATGIASIYTYDDPDYPAGSKWRGLLNTNSTTPTSTSNGFLLFVRGDRTVGAGTGTPGATTLRSKGSLVIGSVGPMNMYIGANVFSLVANPYACPIKWTTTTKNNITGSFTVYDPNLQSFVTSNGTTVSPNISQQQANVIQSGQAFFTQNDGSGNTPGWSVNESDKIAGAASGSSSGVFHVRPTAQLNVNFYKTDNSFVDGAVAIFNSSYAKGDDEDDAQKFSNFNETIAFTGANSKALSINAKPMPVANDTLFINMSQMTVNNTYNIQIDGSGFTRSNLQSAILVDKTANTTTALDLSTTTSYSFKASSAADAGRLLIILNNKVATGIDTAVNNTGANTNSDLAVVLMGNPVKSQIILQYAAKEAGNATARLLGADGKPLQNIHLGVQQKGTLNIPVAGYASGLYLVELTVGKYKTIVKAIKQ